MRAQENDRPDAQIAGSPTGELKCLPAKLRPLTTCPNFFSMEKPIPPISAGRTGRIPRRRRKEARPGELQAAALELFIEKGFTATRLDDVAARAGVSTGTLYLYFDSKVDLFQSVVDETMTPTLDAADHLIDTHASSSEELIRRLITNLWEHVVGSPLEGMTKLVVSEARNFPQIAQLYYDKVIHRSRLQLLRVVERAIHRGEFRSLNAKATVDAFILPILMMALWRHSFSDCGLMSDPKHFLPTLSDILIKGLASARRQET